MFFVKENSYCDFCDERLTNWDYKYRGEHYCRKCYGRFFVRKACEKCNKAKMIKRGMRPAICKKCLVKDTPCIRCGKTEYIHGLITKNGPACKSCSKYFREYKECSSCGIKRYDVANRKLERAKPKLLCNSCFSKKELKVCSICHKRHRQFFNDLDQKHICKKCLSEPKRQCKHCGVEIYAGEGHVCRNCSYQETLNRRLASLTPLLKQGFKPLFIAFSSWLAERRGIDFAAIKIARYFQFFLALSQLAEKLESFPTYIEIVDYHTVATTRQYLLVMTFLEQQNLIYIDKKVKTEFSNLDTIDRYLNHFDSSTLFSQILNGYYHKLESKLLLHKTTIRSIRLALTPAIQYLKNCEYFGFDKPSQEVLEGFLWKSPGQRCSIAGFIAYLAENHGSPVNLKKIPAFPKLNRPNLCQKALKQRFIDCLRANNSSIMANQNTLSLAIAYLHSIQIPPYVKLTQSDILKEQDGSQYLKLGGQKFYIM